MPGRDDGVGEIATSSRGVFMGYHREPAATEASFTSDGFYRGGDLGRIDEGGFLVVEGRIKELLVTSGGENVSPLPLEDAIRRCVGGGGVVAQAVVVGEGRKHVACLLALREELDPETGRTTGRLEESVRNWARAVPTGQKEEEEEEEAPTAAAEVAARPSLMAAIWEGVERANAEAAASNAQTVRKVALLPSELTVDGGELTPTMKLRRKVIHEKYSDMIDRMYDR